MIVQTGNLEKSVGKLKVFTPYIDDDTALDYARETEMHDSLNFNSTNKHGGTSQCILVGDHAVLYSKVFTENRVTPEHFQTVMRNVYDMRESGVRVAPILGYVRSEDGDGIPNPRFRHGKARDIVIVKRAPGSTLNDMTVARKFVDKITQRLENENHYDDAIESFMSIMDSPLKPDISANNTMYDPSHSYTFIDFNTLLKAPHTDDERAVFVSRFLKSFVTDKKFQNERQKEEYFAMAAQEQRILAAKLQKVGIPESYLDNAIKKMPQLGSSSIDELFR